MTPHQAKAFEFIRDEISACGIAPSYEEIGRAIGVTTKSGVHRIVDRLILDGKLVKAKGVHARSLRLPDHVDLTIVPTSALQAELQRRGAALGALSVRRVPVLGKIGVPCAADHCAVAVKPGQMFCRDHWYAIPHDVREALKAAHADGDVDAFGVAKADAERAISKSRGRK